LFFEAEAPPSLALGAAGTFSGDAGTLGATGALGGIAAA